MNDTLPWDRAGLADFDTWLARRAGLGGLSLPGDNGDKDQWIYKFTFSFVTTISCMFLALTVTVLVIVVCFLRQPKRRQSSFRLLLSNSNEDIELSEVGDLDTLSSLTSEDNNMKRSESVMSQSLCKHCGKISSYTINETFGQNRSRQLPRKSSKVNSNIMEKVKKSRTVGSLKALLLPAADNRTGLTRKSYSYTNLTEHEDIAVV